MADLRIGRSRLPDLLDKKRMTQADFARRMNISEAFVSQIIKGESKFSLLKAKQAADILGCYIEDLYEWIYEGDR